ncbi:hypothetical protein DENSPDRAFT_831515 [Dentipellis sp. KUC8613]|nr:hypothetical protein DENSPDRAFT_831515 [Dentipellis sp. KUC8613]
MLAAGDSRNGSGVATAWTLSYLLLEQFTQGLKKSERYPRSSLAWVLSGAAATSAALYGAEHFIFQSDADDTD